MPTGHSIGQTSTHHDCDDRVAILELHYAASGLQLYRRSIVVLREQTQAFSTFWEKDEVMKPLEYTILYRPSVAADYGQDVGMVRPWVLVGCPNSLTIILHHL